MKKKKRGKKINIPLHLSNRWLYTFIALGILSIISFGVYALVTTTGGGHPSSDIIVSIGTCKVTLQDAITNGYLKGTATPTTCLSESQFPKAYHTADKILITTDGFTMTLQDAINNNVFKTGATTSYTTTLPVGGHLAGEVEVTLTDNSKMSLQNAITGKKTDIFCASGYGQSCGSCGGTIQCDGTCSIPTPSNYGQSCGSCGGTIQCDGTCSIPTPSNYGQSCYPSGVSTECTNAGTIDCSGNCVGYSYKPEGTTCETDKLCDGSGNCAGIVDMVPSFFGYSGATVETYTSCKGNVAFYNKDNIKDGDDNTYSQGTTISAWWDSRDPLTCVYDWTVTLPYGAQYIKKIEFITAIDSMLSGRTRELWLEYYDGSWKTLHDSGAVTSSEGKTTRTFYIADPSTQKVSKVRVRVELKRTSKYQTINHYTYVYSTKMFGRA